MKGLDDLVSRDAELVLGLVGPVGTELDKFVAKLQTALRQYKYTGHEVRLSSLAEKLSKQRPIAGESKHDRRVRLMDTGDELRRARPDVLALAAAHQIHRGRASPPQPLPATAHILRSLKHPAEVHALRRIYGPGFFLIGVVTDRSERVNLLACEEGYTPEQIAKTLRRDEHDGDGGQRTRDTFQLADVFIRGDDVKGLQRFLRLVFGHPHETPQPDEHAMFLAFTAALRSADLSRQVGAAITSKEGDLLAIGMNDVPDAGGGLGWPGPADPRDHVEGYDTNERRRTEIVDEIIETLRPSNVSPEDWRERGWRAVKAKGAGVLDITEYGRAVHAEMEALLSCARNGTSTRGATLYTTTFPCHNCAKHIIAAGVQRVVYVEPYPKSQAEDFYKKMIDVMPVNEGRSSEPNGKVRFEPFVGIGPRRFFDLFSIGLSSGLVVKRKVEGGDKRPWDPLTAAVRVPLFPNSYLIRESLASELLSQSQPQGEPSDQEE